MNRRRWTGEMLANVSDADFAAAIIEERMSDLPNPYTPFAQRLADIRSKLQEIGMHGGELVVPDTERTCSEEKNPEREDRALNQAMPNIFFRAVVPRSNAERRGGLKILSVACKAGRKYLSDQDGHRFFIEEDMDVNGNPYHRLNGEDGQYRLYKTMEAATMYHRQYLLHREYCELTRGNYLCNCPVSALETVLTVLKGGGFRE